MGLLVPPTRAMMQFIYNNTGIRQNDSFFGSVMNPAIKPAIKPFRKARIDWPSSCVRCRQRTLVEC